MSPLDSRAVSQPTLQGLALISCFNSLTTAASIHFRLEAWSMRAVGHTSRHVFRRVACLRSLLYMIAIY